MRHLFALSILVACSSSTAANQTAVQLAFSVQPRCGTPMNPPVQVAIEDATGHVVARATNVVSLSMGANNLNAALSGTTSRTASGGIASFADLTVSPMASGYVLIASSIDLPSVTSSAFTGGSCDTLTLAPRP